MNNITCIILLICLPHLIPYFYYYNFCSFVRLRFYFTMHFFELIYVPEVVENILSTVGSVAFV